MMASDCVAFVRHLEVSLLPVPKSEKRQSDKPV